MDMFCYSFFLLWIVCYRDMKASGIFNDGFRHYRHFEEPPMPARDDMTPDMVASKSPDATQVELPDVNLPKSKINNGSNDPN